MEHRYTKARERQSLKSAGVELGRDLIWLNPQDPGLHVFQPCPIVQVIWGFLEENLCQVLRSVI
jgi:hypothetical protein